MALDKTSSEHVGTFSADTSVINTVAGDIESVSTSLSENSSSLTKAINNLEEGFYGKGYDDLYNALTEISTANSKLVTSTHSISTDLKNFAKDVEKLMQDAEDIYS